MKMIHPSSPRLHRCPSLLILTASLLTAANITGMAHAQDQQAQPLVSDDRILRHLNNVITWYRNVISQVQPAGLPSDAIYQGNAEAIASQVVIHAFESAEKAAPLIPETAQSSSPGSRQQLLKTTAETTANNAQLQSQISALDGRIASAPKKNLAALQSQRDVLQGELDLGQATLQALKQVVQSSDSKGKPTANGFLASITELKGSIPEVFGPKAKNAAPSASQPATSSAGLLGKLHQIYRQSLALHSIDTLLESTGQLQDFVNGMHDPLRNAIRSTLQRGRDLSSAVDHPQAGAAPPTKQDFDQLAARFDQLAAVGIPLSQEVAALGESKANLADWRASIEAQYRLMLRSVLISVAVIVGILGLLLLVSGLWKRMIFRYISDVRRRRQFLIVRRFVIGFFIGLVFIFSFVTEFSALATFAGFITAGLAVGLQTVLLSVAAYFFLIGRYGIRVGDRISISGVTGDVIDIGFVRFYMLELGGTGVDLTPTGRVVAFPNSVLFQAATPMFRQVPGTAFTWHEVAVPLQPTGDHDLVEEKMLEVVTTIYKGYKATLDHQHGLIEQRFEIPFTPLAPKGQLQLTTTGLEAVVRYPVSLRQGNETDDTITRRLIDTFGKNEGLKSSVAGLPIIRSAIRAA